jgi:flagellar basal-body rod modification protein FlgD
MIDINQLTGAQTGGLNPSVSTGGDEMGQDTFIKLLTTQMQNQDPMSPMDNQAFIQQLTSFSSLEQLMGLQQSMQAVYMGIASMNNSSMANLLGTEVVGRGNKQHYDGDGEMDFHWNSEELAADMTISVMDDGGRLVATFQVPGGCEKGEGSYSWDGKKGVIDGRKLEEGSYSFRITAVDQQGELVATEEWVRGVVTEMDYSGEVPQPSILGVPISLGDIVRLSMPTHEDGASS